MLWFILLVCYDNISKTALSKVHWDAEYVLKHAQVILMIMQALLIGLFAM
jgi:hypothetical protein